MREARESSGTLAWVVRSYAWVVVLLTLTLGVVVPAFVMRAPDSYEAQAQVGLTESLKLTNLDAFPRLGQSIFANGAVADAVRQSLDPPPPPATSVIPERVELVAPQDNIVFTVIGHGGSPAGAQAVANVAAATFADELNKYAEAVGSFAIQQLAERPTRTVDSLTVVEAVAVGVASGLVAGVGVALLMFLWRRPVLTAEAATEAAQAPVLGVATLHDGRAQAATGLARLCSRALPKAIDSLFLVGPDRGRRDRRALATAIAHSMRLARTVVPVADDNPSAVTPAARPRDRSRRPELYVWTEPPNEQLVARTPSSLLVLVAHRGVPHGVLRRQSEQLLDDGEVGVVLVHRRRAPFWSSLRRRSSSILRGLWTTTTAVMSSVRAALADRSTESTGSRAYPTAVQGGDDGEEGQDRPVVGSS